MRAIPFTAFRKIAEAVEDGIIVIDRHGAPVFTNGSARALLRLEDDPSSVYPLLKKTLSVDPLQVAQESERDIRIRGDHCRVCICPLFTQQAKTGAALLFKKTTVLQEADKNRTDFVSIASHELRNPLTAAKNALEILAALCGGDDIIRQERFLEIARRNLERINGIVNQYLDVTRIETGRTPLDFKRLSLTAVVNRVMEDIAADAGSRDIVLRNDIPRDVPDVLGDASKLEQVFFNLIGNALKFSDPGSSITVTAGVAGACRQALHQPERPMIRVGVADTGPGIPARQKKLIFEKFYRIKDVAAAERTGVGLGLPIVKKLVELHGGEIRVENNRPCGSCFWFTLPVYAGERRDPAFRWIFNKKLQAARQKLGVLSLLAVVIEGLQTLGRRPGAARTDRILYEIESAIKGSVYRETDSVVRRPGQDMFVVFCDAGKEGAASMCGRIRKCVADSLQKRIPKLHKDIRISVGFATYPEDAGNQKDLLRIALKNTGEKRKNTIH